MASDRVIVANVFTPSKPARLAFVEREHINEKLVNALKPLVSKLSCTGIQALVKLRS